MSITFDFVIQMQVSLFDEIIFTKISVPTMKNYMIFAHNLSRTPELVSQQELFKNWLMKLKPVTNRWRVSQKIQWMFPSTSHIQLSIEMMKVWHIDSNDVQP